MTAVDPLDICLSQTDGLVSKYKFVDRSSRWFDWFSNHTTNLRFASIADEPSGRLYMIYFSLFSIGWSIDLIDGFVDCLAVDHVATCATTR